MDSIQIAPNHKVLGSILLISGSCIGAGMLGLPVLSAAAGFQPTVFMFILCWFFVTLAGLLLVEVNLWFSDEVSILSMAERTLGKFGKAAAWVLFLFLFYSLTLAFVAGGGSILVDLLAKIGIALPISLGPVVVAFIFGLVAFLGTGTADWFNRFLMFGLIFSYVFLVGLGSSHVQSEFLQHKSWVSSLFLMPVMFISFGFHNLVPSLKTYLKGNAKQLRLAVIIGSLIPLVVYLVWIWLILGLVPHNVASAQEAMDSGGMATEMLSKAINAPWVIDLARTFGFLAIVTSLLGVTLSLLDFLADGLKIEKTPKGRFVLTLLSIVPPLIFAYIYPNLFLSALNMAGGFGAAILFCIIPVIMAWKGRYSQGRKGVQLVPGGKFSLVCIFLFGLLVLGIEIYQELQVG